MRRRLLPWLVALAAAAAPESASRGDDPPPFLVIVHPDNPVDAVDAAFLRSAYLRKADAWEHGPAIDPLDLTPRFPARARFAQKVLRKSLPQLRAYWHQQIFSGKGTPPPQVDSVGDAVAHVIAHRGAVAYLPADADPGDAKVVDLR
jgi:hypothetical protein